MYGVLKCRAGMIHRCIDEIDPRAHDTVLIWYPEMYPYFNVNSPRCIIINEINKSACDLKCN